MNCISIDSLRLLQLEHGGDKCNCWEVERLEIITANNESMEIQFTQENRCYRRGTNSINNRFCGHFARETRGIIFKELSLDGLKVDGCPGDSSDTLISPRGTPAMSETCASNTTQM